MGGCTSRENDIEENQSSIPYSNLMESCARKNFNKGYRFNDADFILYSFNGDIASLRSAIDKQEIPDLLSVRGFSQVLQLNLSTMSSQLGISSSSSINELESKVNDQGLENQFSTKMWNPTLFAVYNNQLDTVKFLVNESSTQINKMLCLCQNPFNSEKQTNPCNNNSENQCLALLIAIANKNLEMLQYLLNGLHYLWKASHLRVIVKEIVNSDWDANALGHIINGRCFKQIYSENDGLESKLHFLNLCFAHIFQKTDLINQDDEISSFDDEEQRRNEMQLIRYEELKKKWRFSICKKFLQSEYSVDFALFLIKYNNHLDQELYLRTVNVNIQDCQYSDFNYTKSDIDLCLQDQNFQEDLVRNIYDNLIYQLSKDCPILTTESPNYSIQLLRSIKQGDLIGIQKILKNIKNSRLEYMFDFYGEVEFSEEEQDKLLKLFQTKDVSVLRRINPITMAIIYNQVDILKLFQEKLGLILRRKHMKGPLSGQFKSQGACMIFEGGCQFKNYSMFIYLWDNFPHLFKFNDLCEGTRIILECQDKILTKHILTAHTTHQFFNNMSFAYRFVYLNEFVFSHLNMTNYNQSKTKNYINLISAELCSQPYSFYSFALFYERGDIFKCLRSLDQTNQRDLRIFVKNNPKSADKFINELIKDEVAMKLYQNSQIEENQNPQQDLGDKNDEKRINWQHRIESIKLFRLSMDNLARALQVELKLLDINEMTRSKSSSQN